ncbi:helix-turn-helix domain-containing protein [Ruminiclostridium cellobioparum]|jgi:septum formation inhibitor-activating ATPase MinD|uniref:helix-turn-helix domain-containing protein n=1 Tax=Ruminiclostridium cellobioparum TaxID=29355 RepID=UPI000A4C30F7|nr:helix-turn-helix domain-containing protein [Ruminiclostridium cellobioparum]
MEKERIGIVTTNPDRFIQIVRQAQQGDKVSMNEIINLFSDDIEYLSRYIMLPREDAIQSLRVELINIVHDQMTYF